MRPGAAGALRAVALVPGLATRSIGALPPRLIGPHITTTTCSSSSSTSYSLTVRCFSCQPTTHAPSSSSSSSSSSSGAPSAPGSRAPIRDEKIAERSSYVRLVDPKTGALAGPFATKQILSKLDRTKFWLHQVAPPQPDRTSIDYDPTCPPSTAVDVAALVQFPICKLIDKKDQFDKQRALKRSSSTSTSNTDPSNPGSPAVAQSALGTSKEVQLTWSVSPNDLAHKLTKARKELIKGARINLVVTTKSGSPKYIQGFNPSEDARRQQLLDHIDQFLCSPHPTTPQDLPDHNHSQRPIARRLKDVDWQRGGSVAVMSFECFRSK